MKDVTLENYPKLATSTECNYDQAKFALSGVGNLRLLHAAIGLCTETGEFQDQLKKHIFYGKPLDRVNLAEELGDVMWYVGIACMELDVPLQEVLQKNIDKLRARYPEKFTQEAALNRNLDAERKILEGGNEN